MKSFKQTTLWVVVVALALLIVALLFEPIKASVIELDGSSNKYVIEKYRNWGKKFTNVYLVDEFGNVIKKISFP